MMITTMMRNKMMMMMMRMMTVPVMTVEPIRMTMLILMGDESQ